MRYIGLDIGTKTIGIAISDKTGILASPLEVIKFTDTSDALSKVITIINQYNITEVIIGLPKNMDNSEGFASHRSIEFKELLAKEFMGLIHFIDERLTTKEAEKILIERGKSREKRKKEIDALAATLILDTYLKKAGKNNE